MFFKSCPIQSCHKYQALFFIISHFFFSFHIFFINIFLFPSDFSQVLPQNFIYLFHRDNCIVNHDKHVNSLSSHTHPSHLFESWVWRGKKNRFLCAKKVWNRRGEKNTILKIWKFEIYFYPPLFLLPAGAYDLCFMWLISLLRLISVRYNDSVSTNGEKTTRKNLFFSRQVAEITNTITHSLSY